MQASQISLSKGIYNLVKDYLKQNNKLSDFNKQRLELELETAKILSGQEIPESIVSINSNVKVRDIDTNQDFEFNLVAPEDVKIKNNKLSVLSPIGLALIGYNVGQEVQWEMPDGFKRYRIERCVAS